MYVNLECEMLKSRISRRDLAKKLTVSYQTITNKLNRTTQFTRDEMYSIKQILNTDVSLEELFELEEIK
jgi:Trp operon repressor